MKTAIVMFVALCLAMPATAQVIMDPTTNNGSFETPVGDDYTPGPIPGWHHPGGNSQLQIRRPAYLSDPATNGDQSLWVVSLAGWYSDVLTNVPLVAGSTISLSADVGWDSWVNASPPPGGSTFYLYAVPPSLNLADEVQILQFSVTPNYNGFGTDAGWKTGSNSGLVQGAWDGWYAQVVVAGGGYANELYDNFVVNQITPPPPTYLRGDFNQDHAVNAADIAVMLQAIADISAYQNNYHLDNTALYDVADVNNDTVISNADIQSLLNLLKNGGGSSSAVPEPSTLLLAFFGAGILLLGNWHRHRSHLIVPYVTDTV